MNYVNEIFVILIISLQVIRFFILYFCNYVILKYLVIEEERDRIPCIISERKKKYSFLNFRR